MRIVPKAFYSLREVAEEVGKQLFPNEWSGEEGDARALPPADEGARLVEDRAQLRIAAGEAGLRDHPPYDVLNPPPPPPNHGGGAGMPEPDTPMNRLRRRLWGTDWIDKWPKVGSNEYERERAAHLRWAELESELTEALREGYLTAVVQKADGSRHELSPRQWRKRGTKFCIRTSSFQQPALYGPHQSEPCEVSADSLRKLLSLSQQMLDQRYAVDPLNFGYRTGLPGRPSLKDAIIRLDPMFASLS